MDPHYIWYFSFMLHFSHKKWKNSLETQAAYIEISVLSFWILDEKFYRYCFSCNSPVEKLQIRDNHRRNCSTNIFGNKIIHILYKITYWKSNVTDVWQKNYGKNLRGLLGLGRGYVRIWGGIRIIFRIRCFPVYMYVDSKIILQSCIFGWG